VKTGDPRQAMVLGVVAVAAVGFLAFQLLPKGGSPAPAPPAESVAVDAAPPPGPAAPSRLPLKVMNLQLSHDPFSHPRLAGRTSGDRPAPDDPEDLPAREPGRESVANGLAPLPGVLAVDGLSLRPVEDPGGTGTEDRDAPRQNLQEERRSLSVRISAIVAAGAPVAMIGVAGEPTRMYRTGEALGPGVVVEGITETEVVLRTPHGVRKLKAGDEVEL
jgi:hypothetical protein